MIYSSVSAAVVSALAAEAKGGISSQAWQKLYSPIEDETGDLAGLFRSGDASVDRNHVDYWLAARLHHLLIPRHWDVLVAKYSTHKAKKVAAIAAIKPLIASPAPALFVFKAVTVWAIPKLKGARPKVVRSVAIDIPLDASEWRRQSLVNAAVAAGRIAQRNAQSRSSDLIVLPDSFYDMNTWDLESAAESTRRRWRAGVHEVLNEMVSEALRCAEKILQAEGLLLDNAA